MSTTKLTRFTSPAVFLILVGVAFPALAVDVYFGNFDDRPTYKLVNSYTDPDRSGWFDWSGLVTEANTSTTRGVVTGTQSLAWQPGAVGWYQGLAVKFQIMPLTVAERNALIEGMLANTHIAVNITWDNSEWAAQYTGSGWNGSQIFSLALNYGPGGTYQDQGFPDIDSGNPGSPGHWDLANYPGVHNRVVMWDYSAHKAALQAMYDAGTMNGQNGWLEIMLTTNAGNFNYPVTYYIDGWRFMTPGAGLPGDYNEDGSVDAADYPLWRKDPASFGGDPAGYNTWRTNFGATAPAGSGTSVAGVPEPAAWLLVAMGMFVTAAFGRRR